MNPNSAVHNPVLANIACATVALDGRLEDCNSAFTQLTGYHREQLSNSSLFSLTQHIDMFETFSVVKKLLSGEMRVWDANRNLVDTKGSNLSVHLTLSSISQDDKPSHYLLMLLPRPQSPQIPQNMNHVQFANAVVAGTAAAVSLGLANVVASTPFKNKEAASSFSPAYDSYNLDIQAF
jgi:PAS domain S-box-containing protein